MLAVGSFLTHHFYHIGFGYQLFESAHFYKQTPSSRLFGTMGKISFVIGAAFFVDLLSRLCHNNLLSMGLSALPIGGGVFLLTGRVGRLVNRYFRLAENPSVWMPEGASEEVLRNTTIQWGRSNQEMKAQILLAARIIVNIALVCLSGSPYLLLGTIGCQTMSLITTARWRTVKYTRIFDSFEKELRIQVDGVPLIERTRVVDPRIQRIAFSYFCPLFPSRSDKNHDCIVSYCGNEGKEMSQSCLNHAGHDGCIVGSIYHALERFHYPSPQFWLENFYNKKRSLYLDEEKRVFQIRYRLHLTTVVFPKCPACRSPLIGGTFQIDVADRELPGQFFPATIRVRDRSNLRT